MTIILLLLAVSTFFFGILILSSAKSAIHEIEAFIIFLISAVFIVGAFIVDSVNQLQKKILRNSERK